MYDDGRWLTVVVPAWDRKFQFPSAEALFIVVPVPVMLTPHAPVVERRTTVTEIASLLCDTEAIVRKHYVGWVQSDRMIDNLNARLKNA